MVRSREKLVTILSVTYALLFSLCISIVTIVLVDGVIAAAIITCSVLNISYYAVVQFISAVLRVWFSIFMGHLELFGRMTIVLSGDTFRPNESALVVCNHRSWADTVVIYSLARQIRMHGDVKFLAKRSLLLFPVYGFAGYILDVVIFIKRQSSSAGRRMTKVFSSLTDPRRRRSPYWLINYLEGTRFTQKKLLDAHAFAKKRDLKVLNQVLQPRTKGFISTVHALRGNATAVYDITIGYTESDKREIKPSFREMYFRGSLTDRVIHVHQRRIPIADIPQDDEELKKWIYKLYEQKDQLIESFRQHGKFDGRPLRWNRMTLGFWLHCQFVVYMLFFILLYCVYSIVTRQK